MTWSEALNRLQDWPPAWREQAVFGPCVLRSRFAPRQEFDCWPTVALSALILADELDAAVDNEGLIDALARARDQMRGGAFDGTAVVTAQDQLARILGINVVETN